ncbi:uncharacterized protein LOC107610707 [Arachis ipaensis]|uniref:uncharacterized protein LOC107610707 n=1 Tax=Arachis ipaensis TaxID=130454 RepID=UPI0007AF3287|nr:uncharacterized protein LOC107610707 [Arachis ipaensis]
MAPRRQGQSHTRGESEGNSSANNQTEFMAAMTNLENSMQACTSVTAKAMERLGQPIGNGNGNGEGAGNNLGGALMTLASFLKVHPPTFRGTTNSTEADNWFRAMERALQTQHVPDNKFREFTAYRLMGEAPHWWQEECRLLQLQNVDILWDVFQTAFYKKYFPEFVREARELELMQLKQGSLSVVEYTSKFEDIRRFYWVCQGVHESYESWKSIKYQGGIKDDIMTAVTPLEIRRFSELVNKAQVVEDCAKKIAVARDNRGDTDSQGRRDRWTYSSASSRSRELWKEQ